MALESHEVITRRDDIATAAQALIDDNSVTAANFQGISIAWSATGDEILIVIIADTGA